MNIKVILLATLFLVSGLSHAQNYYVDATAGNDRWSGKIASPNSARTDGPWKTLDKVNSYARTIALLRLQAGDRVKFKRGEVWEGSLKINVSGGAGNPIVFEDYGSTTLPKPRIVGAERIFNWTPTNTPGVYYWIYDGSIESMFDDHGHMYEDYQPKKHGSSPSLRDEVFFWDRTATPTRVYYRPSSGYLNHAVHYANVKAAIDIDKDSKGLAEYIIVQNLEVVLGSRGVFLHPSKGANDITIKNLDVRGVRSGIVSKVRHDCGDNGAMPCIFKNVRIESNNISNSGQGIELMAADNIGQHDNAYISRNSIRNIDPDDVFTSYQNLDEEGIGLQNTNNSMISYNYITGVSEGAIVLWVKPTSRGDNNSFIGNNIENIEGSGITTGSSDGTMNNITIANNRIYRCGYGHTDNVGAGGIRVNTPSPGSRVHNNEISLCDISLYLYARTDHWVLQNNYSYAPTRYHVRRGGGPWETGQTSGINNNILDYNHYYPLVGKQFRFKAVDYDFETWKAVTLQDTHSDNAVSPNLGIVR